MEIYKHKITGEFLMLVKVRNSGINTFLQVDELGVPIIKDRSWSVKPSEQRRLVKLFDNLIKLK